MIVTRLVSVRARPTLRVMTSLANDCWRLSGYCSRWAQESRDNATRLAFRQMAQVWAQLAFSEEFTNPADEWIAPQSSESSQAPAENPGDERTDPAGLESSEPIPAENAAPSPVVPLTENEIDDVGKCDPTRRASTEKISKWARAGLPAVTTARRLSGSKIP
jgi:hypothetical protein